MLKCGNIGVIPTDTLYGLVASALDPVAVERVYRVRGRDEGKPCIALIGDVADLVTFGIDVVPLSEMLGKFWPGKVSVVLPCADEKWQHLHRDTGTIAFRLPHVPELRALLRETGPIIAPSANPQGKPPAETIENAKSYFGDAVDFFVDGGTLHGEPSTVVRFEEGKIVVVREGVVKIADI